jgi:hypothetical protein
MQGYSELINGPHPVQYTYANKNEERNPNQKKNMAK